MTQLAASSLGLADCEAIGTGLLGQPSNSLSSLAFIAVGIGLAAWSRSVAKAPRRQLVALGLAAALAGLGSLAYHGTMGPTAQFLHDFGLLLLPLVVVAVTSAGQPGRTALRNGTLGALLGATTMGIWPSTGVWLVLVTGAVAVGLEVLRWRAAMRRKTTTTRWRLAGASVSGLAAISLYVLGRTGGPWCNPDSWLQPHAGWHILMATSVALFALSWAGGRRNSLDPK